MDIERQFEDLGVDAITGIQLMRSLGLYPDDFIDEARFLRFKDVIDYFKEIPDRDYLFNKILIGKNVDKLDQVWGYTQLAKQKDKLKSTLDVENKKLEVISSLGDELETEKQRGVINNHQGELLKVNEQIDKYEA